MSELLDSLATHPATEVIRRTALAGFLSHHRRALMLFTGDFAKHPEAHDVAIVARELLKKYDGQLHLGLVDRRDETSIMARLGVVVLPALAFVADGRTLEVVARMRDWSVYAQAAARLMAYDEGEAR